VPFAQFNRTLEAAVGFFELGMAEEALRELDSLPPSEQGEEEVLEFRLVLYQHMGRWDDASQACARLCQCKGADIDRFIAWGCCLYELARVDECRRALLQAPEEARQNGLWNFHLACYEAILGCREEARRLVVRAVELDPALRCMAECNENLSPLLKPR
jgi:tetratricopeptide (TPR) repeat protein